MNKQKFEHAVVGYARRFFQTVDASNPDSLREVALEVADAIINEVGRENHAEERKFRDMFLTEALDMRDRLEHRSQQKLDFSDDEAVAGFFQIVARQVADQTQDKH